MIIALTKASAMPFDCGLSIGVVRGTRPISPAKARVLPAVYGEPLSDSHSIAAGSRLTRLERATPTVSAMVFTACRPERTRASATAVFLAVPDQALRAGSRSRRSSCPAAAAVRAPDAAKPGIRRPPPPLRQRQLLTTRPRHRAAAT